MREKGQEPSGTGITTIPELISHVVYRHGDTALIESPSQSLTYREVDAMSAGVARGLLAEGAGKGTRVGLLMPNSPEWVVSWLGALRVGALVSGVSTFLKPPELEWALRYGDIDTLLMVEGFLRQDFAASLEQSFPELRSQSGARPLRVSSAPYLRSIWVSGNRHPCWSRGSVAELADRGDALNDADEQFLRSVEAEVSPADQAIVIFTSGSSSHPKAVVHTQGSMVRHADAIKSYCTCEPGERVGVISPFFWVGGMLTGLLNTMLSGGTVVLADAPDPTSVLEMIRTRDIDYLISAAGAVRAIASHPEFRPEDFQRLRPSRARQARLAFFGPQPDHSLDLVPDSLGMTETFGPHSAELPGTVLPESLAGSFGRPVGLAGGGIERRIVSPETGEEVPAGEQGELLIRGYCMMQGYYKKEREETFDREGFLHTGDLASIDATGHLFFAGRRDEVIKTSDANVSSLEVEAALEELPEVKEAAVVGQPDEIAGEIVVAFVVTASEGAIDEGAMREALRERLSSYKVPRRICRIPAEEVPRTDAGKIAKSQLAKRMGELLEPVSGEAAPRS